MLFRTISKAEIVAVNVKGGQMHSSSEAGPLVEAHAFPRHANRAEAIVNKEMILAEATRAAFLRLAHQWLRLADRVRLQCRTTCVPP